MKKRSINKRWLFIPNKAAHYPSFLSVQRMHLWLLSCSNYWLAEAFEKSAINPGIWKKQKTAACFLPGTVIDEALRSTTPTEASSPTLNYGRRLPGCCFHIFFQSTERTIVIDNYKTPLMSEILFNCSASSLREESFTRRHTSIVSVTLSSTATRKLFQQANETSMHTKP